MSIKYDQVHETVLRDIINLYDDVKDVTDTSDFFGRGKGISKSSIMKATSDLVIVFPFMCDNSISIDTATMNAKAIERQALTMLQMLFASFQVSDAKDGVSYIRQFHTNIKNDGMMSVDDFLDIMDKFVDESSVIVDRDRYESIKESLMHLYDRLPDSINEESINDYTIHSINGSKIALKENKEGKGKGNKPHKDPYKDIVSALKGNITAQTGNTLADTSAKNAKFKSDMSNAFSKQILDSDAKKANELVPSMMVVNFLSANNDKKVMTSFVCGVKCRLIPVDPYDIANRIMIRHTDRNVLQSFIKATTKEISFFKDFLFAIERAKIDAISSSNRGSSHPMWKVLERRANKSRMRQFFRQPNDAAAITTLGISREVVEYIKKQNNIDLDDAKEAAKIMESLNLMGIFIIDEAAEVDSILWDNGEKQYETLSFNALERDTSGGEYKKALNLMAKTYR